MKDQRIYGIKKVSLMVDIKSGTSAVSVGLERARRRIAEQSHGTDGCQFSSESWKIHCRKSL